MTGVGTRDGRLFVPSLKQDLKDRRHTPLESEETAPPQILPDNPQPDEIADSRTPGGKDRDRVLYSHSFLRLVEVTQISTPDSTNPRIHNRLSHSLKVAQVARSLAEHLILRNQSGEQRDLITQLGGLDPEVAEAAGLAHDLGHPPFGHAGEVYLDEICLSQKVLSLDDGFEGNAQTFRIATSVDASYGYGYGLGLTAGTRAALLKYPWFRSEPEHPTQKRDEIPRMRKKKFGYYKGTETAAFTQAREWLQGSLIGPNEQSLEAAVMDTADDITYAIHDLEDFLTMGVINHDEIAYACAMYSEGNKRRGSKIVEFADSLTTRYPKRFNEQHLQHAVNNLLEQRLPSPEWQPARLRDWRSHWIEECLKNTQISRAPVGGAGAHVEMASEVWHSIELFKFFAQVFVIDRREMGLLQAGEERVLLNALKLLKKWRKRERDRGTLPSRLPLRLQSHLDWSHNAGEPSDRALVDYLCSLGDAEVTYLVAAMSGDVTQPKWVGQEF